MNTTEKKQEFLTSNKSLSSSLLCLAALLQGIMIIRLFSQINRYCVLSSLFNILGKFSFEVVPPILLMYYLFCGVKKEKVLRCSLGLVAIGGLFYSLWPMFISLAYDYSFGPFMAFNRPIIMVNISVLAAALIMLGEIRKGRKKALPWICAAEALVFPAYYSYVVIHRQSCALVYIFAELFFWGALFAMSKDNLFPLDNS